MITFKINGKQMIKMLKKGEYVRFKNYERKKYHSLWFMQIFKIFYYQKIMESKI